METRWTKDYRGYLIRNRYHGANDWYLTADYQTQWGTLEQVKGFIDHLIEHGRLPESQAWKWA